MGCLIKGICHILLFGPLEGTQCLQVEWGLCRKSVCLIRGMCIVRVYAVAIDLHSEHISYVQNSCSHPENGLVVAEED